MFNEATHGLLHWTWEPGLVVVGLELFHNVVGENGKGCDRGLKLLQCRNFPRYRANPKEHGINILFGAFALCDRSFQALINYFSEE